MKTQFTVCGSWSHVQDVVRGFQFHDVSRFSESAGYVELRRNANDRGHAHGADIRVVVCGEPGKHAYARDEYKRATRIAPECAKCALSVERGVDHATSCPDWSNRC